jgi:hypothetical protein
MCLFPSRATFLLQNCIHYRPGFGSLNGYVMLVQRKPVLGRVPASLAPILDPVSHAGAPSSMVQVQAFPWLCSSTWDVIPLHVQCCMALSAMRQGQKVLSVFETRRIWQRPVFESCDEGIVCSDRSVTLHFTWWTFLALLSFSAFQVKINSEV